MKKVLMCCAVILCASLVLADPPSYTMKAAIMDSEGRILPEATMVAQSISSEPVRAEPVGDGTWVISGVGEKTTLYLKDPDHGTATIELNTPGPHLQIAVYWGEKSAEARIISSLADLGTVGIQAFPSISPRPLGGGTREDCPPDSLFSQTPHGPDDSWSFGTSEADLGYLRAESFSGVTGDICDIHWWGSQLYYDPYLGWVSCTDSDPSFEIKFYTDSGGAPGTEVCSYTVTPTITNTGLLYAGFVPLLYYSVDLLSPCCSISAGWVSIQGLGDTDCWFLWCSSGTGDGSSYFNNNGTPEPYDYDNSLCLTGEYVPTYGACCDDSSGICEDDIEQQDCTGRFAADTLCADLDPPCGSVVACDHTIVLTDDYGDGWNGGMVDVLVNGVIALDDITLASGAGPLTYVFKAATGDVISTVYVAGSWSYENEYHIYDVNGTQICADGTGGTTPTGGFCGYGFCEADPCEGNEPPNDECVDATAVSGPYPQTVSGTNYCATIDCPGVLDWYATWWAIDLPYGINELNVSFCGNGFEINNVGVVYYNDCTDCSAYILYDAIDWYSCPDYVTSPIITWKDIPGPTTVYFPVMFNDNAMVDYTIEIDVTEIVPPPNDFCEDAIAVGVPSTTAGWTDAGTIDDGYPDCGSASITSPGVWYSVTGTGNTMTASLCNGVATYDTKLGVYCPDCVDTICVDGNDDFCGLQSEVSWCSQLGANYLILVHGYGGATGPFELDISDDGVPCQGAVKCLPEGACCLLDATCIIINEYACDMMDGDYHGDDTNCGVGTIGGEKARFDCNDYATGTLDGSSPTWDRVYGCNVDTTCNASCYDSSSNGMYYAAFPITSSVSENLEVEIVAANTTVGDTVMTLYCDPFDPADPMANVVAYDDDGAGYPYSGFYASDGIYLDAGITYYLVLSTFSVGDMGDFELCLGGSFTVGGGGPGACCMPDGTCAVMEAGECGDMGGYFGGAGTDCETYVCPEYPGACCLDDGTCVITIESCCDYGNGFFVGSGTDCGSGTMTFFSEDFNGGIPVGWTITDDDGSGLKWATNDFWGDNNFTGGTGLCAEASSDEFGSASYDTSLITPMLDMSAVISASLDFEANYQNLAGYDYFMVDVSYDGGGNWTNLLTWNEDHGSFHGTPGEHVTLAIAGGSATTQVRFRYYDPVSHWNWEIQVDDVAITAEVEGLGPCQELDIKPGSCPNSYNRGSHGVLPVALLGTADFDVSMVDISSLLLSRADGVAGSVAPHEGPPGPHTVIGDVATPFYGEGCDCHEETGDGIPDLSMKFKTDNVVPALELNDLDPGTLVALVLSGTTYDGKPFIAHDCIRLVPPGTSPGHCTVFSNAPETWIEITPLDDTLDGGGFADFDRTYGVGSLVTFSADEAHGSFHFVRWVVDGVPQQRGAQELQLEVIDGTTEVEAVYRQGTIQEVSGPLHLAPRQ